MPTPSLRPVPRLRPTPSVPAPPYGACEALRGASLKENVQRSPQGCRRASSATSRSSFASVPTRASRIPAGASGCAKTCGTTILTLAAALLAGSVTGGALLMQDREPLDTTARAFSTFPTRPHRLSFASSRSQWSALHRRLSSAEASTATSASAEDVYEDAEEGLGGADDWSAAGVDSPVRTAAGSLASLCGPRRSSSSLASRERERLGTLSTMQDLPFVPPERELAPSPKGYPRAVISYGYARGDPERDGAEGVGLGEEEEETLTDEEHRGLPISGRPRYGQAWSGREPIMVSLPRPLALPESASLDLDVELLTFNDDDKQLATSYSPRSRLPSIFNLAQVSDSPVESLPSPPTSPAEDNFLSSTPALSSPRSMSPSLSIPITPSLPDFTVTDSAIVSSPTASSATSTFSGPRARPSASPTALSPLTQASTRSASAETTLSRRSSSGLSSSKSARRLSNILTSGFGFGRSRTSSSISSDAVKPSSREAKRRPRTSDGTSVHSAPLLSVPSFPFPAQAPSFQPLRSRSPSPLRPSLSPDPTSLGHSRAAGRTWRSTFSPEAYQRLSLEYGTSEMRRQEVIFELCETERAFVAGLEGIDDLFAAPLRTRSGAWSKDVPPPVARLLDWLVDIGCLHAELTAALDAAQSAQEPVVLRVAAAFTPFVDRLEVHQPYLVRLEVVSALLDDLAAGRVSAHDGAREQSSFGEFVRMQSRRPECGGLSLSSFLLKPVQRLMKYPLFFRQLCDLTPPGHPDHAATHALYRATDAMILALQEVKAREDAYAALKALAARTRGLPEGFRLARRDRRLEVHGALRLVHLSERDRAALDALAAGVGASRPRSTASDSGSSLASTASGSLTSGVSDASSAGWASPATPGSLVGASSPPVWARALPPAAAAAEKRKSLLGVDVVRAATPPPPRLRTRAKESTVQAWVFSDVLLLAQPGGKREDVPKVLKTAKALEREKAQEGREPVRVLEGIGASRVVGMKDLSGRTEHNSLVQVDIIPLLGTGKPVSSASLRSIPLFFTVPSSASVPSPRAATSPPLAATATQHAARTRVWLHALATPLAHSQAQQQLDAHTGRLPNASHAPVSTAERRSSAPTADTGAMDERAWWARRLAAIRREMDGEAVRSKEKEGLREPREERTAKGASFPPVWEEEHTRAAAALVGRTGKPPALPAGTNAGLGIDSLAFGRRMSR